MSEASSRIVRAFLSYRDILVGALLRLSVQPSDIDDILQEALARALEANEKSPVRFPKSYLFVVSRNVVFEQQQRRSREVQWQIDDALLENNEAPIDEDLYYRKMLAAFWQAMSTLPKAHQRAILLRRIYGLSHKEIAQKMGVSLSSVEKYFAQGMKRCQDVLSAQGYGVERPEGVAASRAKERARWSSVPAEGKGPQDG